MVTVKEVRFSTQLESMEVQNHLLARQFSLAKIRATHGIQ